MSATKERAMIETELTRYVFQAAVEVQHLRWQRMDQEGRHELCGDEFVGYCGLCQEINNAEQLIWDSGVWVDWDKVAKVARGEEIAGYAALVEMGGKLDEEEV
jgi:hypothetical protein